MSKASSLVRLTRPRVVDVLRQKQGPQLLPAIAPEISILGAAANFKHNALSQN